MKLCALIMFIIVNLNIYSFNCSQDALEKYLNDFNKANSKVFSDDIQTFKGLDFNIKGLTAISNLDPKKPGLAPDWGTEIFEGKRFENLTFINCNFKHLNFTDSVFINIKFINCNFGGAVFDSAIFNKVIFVNCKLKDASFCLSKMEDVLFEQNDASFVNFMQADLQNVVFKENVLEGSNFFASSSNLVKFEGDSENILFFDLSNQLKLNNFLKKPVLLISWNNKKPGPAAAKIVNKIQELGGIPFKFNYHDPEINPVRLKAEVNDILKISKENPAKNTYKSLPKKILTIAKEGNYPEIGKIQQKAHLWINAVSGVLIPGGEDIQPFFYEEEATPETVISQDLRRDVFEFAILDEIEMAKTPVLGVCRGMQVGNIWNGGSLNQHVPGHLHLVQEYELTQAFQNPAASTQSVIAEIFKNSVNGFKGYAIHHQTVKKVGTGLTVIAISNDGTIKAMEKLDSDFEVYVQWHPEFKGDFSTPESIQLGQKLSPGNQEILRRFIEAVNRKQVTSPSPKGEGGSHR